MLTDVYGFPLPVPTQVSKNFDGELEEPDDSAYGDTYFPVVLDPGESRALQLVQVNQNWGTHALKQVSSLRFFNIYWHLSTGSSETTCFTQNWMRIGESQILHIPDFRPLSGPLWSGQPQHDCLQWPGFLQYNDGTGRLIYERTVFESVSPNLTRFSLLYHTSDNAATAKLSVMEIPQRDEMRTFIHLRYDWQKAVTISGDARTQFRWLNVFEKRTPGTLFRTDGSGTTQTKTITASETPPVLGELLSPDSPFAATQATPFTGPRQGDSAQPDYHSMVLVRSFRARLGGQDRTQTALSARFTAKNGSYWFTVPDPTLTLQPGDFVDAEIMLMPHSGPTVPGTKAGAGAHRAIWGTHRPCRCHARHQNRGLSRHNTRPERGRAVHDFRRLRPDAADCRGVPRLGCPATLARDGLAEPAATRRRWHPGRTRRQRGLSFCSSLPHPRGSGDRPDRHPCRLHVGNCGD